jgi:hypothetical protein
LFVRFIYIYIIENQWIDVLCNDNTLCHGYHHNFLQSELESGMQGISFLCCYIVYALAAVVSEGRSADIYASDIWFDLIIGNLRPAAMNTCRFIHSFHICCTVFENDDIK